MEIITLYLIFAMCATLWLDVTRYTIPNWLVGSLLILYPVAVVLSPHEVDWTMAMVAMLAVFTVGYIIFSLRIMGGGDVKLITVLALWVGWGEKLAEFMIMFGLIGGVFSIFVLVARKIEPYFPWKKRFATPRLFQQDAPIPYGVAIGLAFLWMIYQSPLP